MEEWKLLWEYSETYAVQKPHYNASTSKKGEKLGKIVHFKLNTEKMKKIARKYAASIIEPHKGRKDAK